MRLILMRSLAGGVAAAAALYLATRAATPSPTPPATPPTPEETAAPTHSPPALWIGDRQVAGLHDLQPSSPGPSDAVLREVYIRYGSEMRDAQQKRLLEEIQQGEDIDDAFLERAGLPRHDNAMVLEKMETEGVVIW